MSNQSAFIKDIFEALAMTWESGCKTNTTGWDWGCWVYQSWLLMGSLDPLVIVTTAWVIPDRYSDRQSPRSRLAARPWLCKLSAPLWTCITLPTTPNISHLLQLKPLTLPVSPSIILFIFIVCLLFSLSLFFLYFLWPIFLFFFFFQMSTSVTSESLRVLFSSLFYPQEGVVLYSSLPVSASASRGSPRLAKLVCMSETKHPASVVFSH